MNRRLAKRMLHNAAVRNAQGWSHNYDLQGATASISDAAIPGLNTLHSFDTEPASVESLLDIGFALQRALDRGPAVELTPLDRPRTIARALKRRRMRIAESRTWMRLALDAPRALINRDLEIRTVTPGDARAFAILHAGNDRVMRRLSLHATIEGLLDARRNTFYIGAINGEDVATLHLICEKKMAGIYAVGTRRDFRRQGIASTLITRSIEDARARRCDEITLSTASGGNAQRLYERLGFEPVFESHLWTPIARR